MTVEVLLRQGIVTFIDEQDAERVLAHKWFPIKEGKYAAANIKVDGKSRTVQLHRFLLGAVPGQIVDHADGDGLNNRRANLRFATASQSRANTKTKRDSRSGLKGVTRRRPNAGRWHAVIRVGGKKLFLGAYDTKEEAFAAYVAAAKEHYGEFARV